MSCSTLVKDFNVFMGILLFNGHKKARRWGWKGGHGWVVDGGSYTILTTWVVSTMDKIFGVKRLIIGIT